MTIHTPHVDDLIAMVDFTIMSEIQAEGSGLLLSLYNYFDTYTKPLNPREFMDFWASCSIEDRVLFLNPVYRFDGTMEMSERMRRIMRTVAETAFQVSSNQWGDNGWI